VSPVLASRHERRRAHFNRAYDVKAQGTQPAQIGIVGNISQRKRDPNSGYPYNTFADCDGNTTWTVTIDVAPQDRPFLTGRAQVQAIAFCCQGPQLGVTRKVQLKG
jgi:hypothetical protein